MEVETTWSGPSPRVAELIRQGTEALIASPDDVFAEIDAVTLANADAAVVGDPALVAAIRRTNHANLMHWARANVSDPGAPVAPNVGPGTLTIARDLVRRGLDQTSLDAYRTGQNAAWRMWMALAFELTSDPDELAELLDVTARSIFSFVDGTLAGIAAELERERGRLTRGTHAERLEVVTLVVEGAPIAAERASLRLQYELRGHHTAAVVFVDDPSPDEGVLAQVAEVLARAAGATRPFTVLGSSSALWVWVPGREGPDLALVRTELQALPEVRVALGPTAPGIDGFRRSHLDALTTQRLLGRMPAGVRLASYDDVAVVALATQDERRADVFVERTLGGLASAPAALRDTLRIYLQHECNATRTAQALPAHRNTVLKRLARAEALLPAPLSGRVLAVGLALEIVRWLGPR